jgi:hypothetical protein
VYVGGIMIGREGRRIVGENSAKIHPFPAFLPIIPHSTSQPPRGEAFMLPC